MQIEENINSQKIKKKTHKKWVIKIKKSTTIINNEVWKYA
jgi:hypothetical protein